jgi:hypothetical protein
MKTLTACLVLVFALPASAADTAEAALDAGAFADALEACTVATHQGPHPFVRGFTITHQIVADTEAGCEYTQTMPGDMHMACVLSESGRSGLAEEMRRQAEGKLSGSTSDQPTWSSGCEIVTKDGKRLPMQGG